MSNREDSGNGRRVIHLVRGEQNPKKQIASTSGALRTGSSGEGGQGGQGEEDRRKKRKKAEKGVEVKFD